MFLMTFLVPFFLQFQKVLNINIVNVNEKPSAILMDYEDNIKENSPAGAFVANLTVIDEDVGQTSRCRLINGSEYFVLIHSNVTEEHDAIIEVAPNADLNYEVESNLWICIKCTDNGKPPLSIQRSIIVTLLDVNEAPTDIRLSGNHTLPENSPVGWSLGTLSASDPDNGQMLTYALFGQGADVFEVRKQLHVICSFYRM